MKTKLKIALKGFKVSYQFSKQGVIYSILSAFIGAISPYISIFVSAKILDMLFDGRQFKDLIITAGIGLGIIFAVQLIESYIVKLKDYYIEIGRNNYDMAYNNKLFDLDYQQLDSPHTNNLRERIRADSQWGNGFDGLYWSLPWLFGSLFNFITAVIVLIPLFTSKIFWGGFITPIYLIALFLIVAISIIIDSKIILPARSKIMDSHNKYDDKKEKYFNFFTYERYDYKDGKDIRIYQVDKMIDHYMQFGEKKNKRWTKDFARIFGIRGFVNSIKSNIVQGGVYILVVLRAVTGALSVGSVVKYCAAITNFIYSISDMVSSFNEYYATSQRQQAVFEYLEMESEMYHGTLTTEKRADNDYELEFHNVSFKYPETDIYVLKNLNLKFKVGQRTAGVGMNGSGKTTMIKLLCRLYDPTDGEITLNGIDIKKYEYGEYLSIFSVVFQDFKLFSFPLGQNVAASIDYDETQAEHCLELAGFTKYDIETPLYKNYAEEGVEISGGEAQKIAIARALYKDAPFIILDEPTAALDPIAEFEVYSKFNDIVGDKTAIYISHRLSSCRFCDDIVVFDNGEMIQRGSHDTLIGDVNGKYHELWNAQAQYYNE